MVDYVSLNVRLIFGRTYEDIMDVLLGRDMTVSGEC